MAPAMATGRSHQRSPAFRGPGAASNAVDSGDRLAGPGAADDDAALAEGGQIEEVQRLTQLQHHVVGDIDDVVDGAESGRRAAVPEASEGVSAERRGGDAPLLSGESGSGIRTTGSRGLHRMQVDSRPHGGIFRGDAMESAAGPGAESAAFPRCLTWAGRTEQPSASRISSHLQPGHGEALGQFRNTPGRRRRSLKPNGSGLA